MTLRLNDFESACQACSPLQSAKRVRVPQESCYIYAAFLVGCAFFRRDLPLLFPFAPLCSRLFCKTDTRSITFVGFGALLGFSSISLPPASTFSSIRSMRASR